MNREQQIALVMIFLLQTPEVPYNSTIDGVANIVHSLEFLRDPYFDEYDRPADWNTVYAVVKEADERLRRGATAEAYYGELVK